MPTLTDHAEGVLDPAISEVVAAVAKGETLLREKIAQRDALNQEIATLTKALGNQRSHMTLGRPRVPRSSMKTFLLRLLDERGTYGVSAAIAADIARNRGVPIVRSSVSSLLSRLKNEGTVEYDGLVYRFPGRRQ